MSGVGKSSTTSLLAGVKAGRVDLCRVAGNTVSSHMADGTQGRVLVEGFFFVCDISPAWPQFNLTLIRSTPQLHSQSK